MRTRLKIAALVTWGANFAWMAAESHGWNRAIAVAFMVAYPLYVLAFMTPDPAQETPQ